MALDLAFSEAFIRLPEPRVLGWKLRPFSLWHQAMMEEIESPFLTGKPAEWPDLVRAVAICRCRHPEVKVKLPKLGWFITFAMLALRMKKSFDAFIEYTKQARSNPDYAIHPQKGAESVERGAVPSIFRIHLSVLSITRCTPSQAWDWPVGEASWYHSESLKRMGCDVDYRTDDFKSSWEDFKAKNPEIAAQCTNAREQWLKEQGGNNGAA